jgi:hypothetical protein
VDLSSRSPSALSCGRSNRRPRRERRDVETLCGVEGPIRLSPGPLPGHAIETFIRREDSERFIEEVLGDPELASTLRIEERGLEAGGLN